MLKTKNGGLTTSNRPIDVTDTDEQMWADNIVECRRPFLISFNNTFCC